MAAAELIMAHAATSVGHKPRVGLRVLRCPAETRVFAWHLCRFIVGAALGAAPARMDSFLAGRHLGCPAVCNLKSERQLVT